MSVTAGQPDGFLPHRISCLFCFHGGNREKTYWGPGKQLQTALLIHFNLDLQRKRAPENSNVNQTFTVRTFSLLFLLNSSGKLKQRQRKQPFLSLPACPAVSPWGSSPERCPQLQCSCSWILLTPLVSHSLFALKYLVKWFIWVVNLPSPLGKALRCKMTWNLPDKNESMANFACTEKEAINQFQQAHLFIVVDYEGKAICQAELSDCLLGFAFRLTCACFKTLQLW